MAGIVAHPGEWRHGGYNKIQSPPKRYRIIDRGTLASLLGLKDYMRLQAYHLQWVEEVLSRKEYQRQGVCSEGVAVGGQQYIQSVMEQLGINAKDRSVYHEAAGLYPVKEPECAYL